MTIQVECDLCGSSAAGTIEELIDQEWVRAVLVYPIKTITRCPEHRDTIRGAVSCEFGD